MSLLRRILMACVGGSVLVLVSAGPGQAAAGDVLRPPGGVYLCGEYSVQFVDGRAPLAPGRVVETGQVFVPSRVSYTVTLDGETSPIASMEVRKGASSLGAVTCTATSPYLGEDGSVIGAFSYSVTGVVRSP